MRTWASGTGRQRRDAVLAELSEQRAYLLGLIRGRMEALCLRGREFVTADDAYRVMEELFADEPVLAWYNPDRRFLGAVFKGAGWTPIGFTVSKRPTNHARTIRKWQRVLALEADDVE